MAQENQSEKKLFRYWRLILVELLLLIIAISALVTLDSGKDIVSIAVVAPLSGEQKEIGENISNSLNLYAERVNKYGGIQGKTLQIDYYDDQGDPDIARQKAQEIVDKNDTIAVLGHFSQETTNQTINLYHQANIPFILPISHVENEHELLFQMSPTPKSYGMYMAHYIKYVLEKNVVTILRSQQAENNDLNLIKAFTDSFTELGGAINTVWKLSDDVATLNSEITHIINEFEQHIENEEVIFEDEDIFDDHMLLLITKEQQTIPFIVALKRNNINLPIMTTNDDIGKKFNDYAEEKKISRLFFRGYLCA